MSGLKTGQVEVEEHQRESSTYVQRYNAGDPKLRWLIDVALDVALHWKT